MQVKINAEIREYNESIFLGLTMRQFIFSTLACAIGGGSFVILNKTLGMEIASWICILIALPFAALGFITFQGMQLEQIVYEFIYSIFLKRTQLIDAPFNLYYQLLKPTINKINKEATKRDKNFRKAKKLEQRKKKSS